MHGVQPILKRIRELSQQQLDGAQVPRLQWFRDVAALESPAGLPLREFPFAVYLITGNAGSGKSTCVQTINEVLDCVVTGATRIAAQNMYAKLSGAFLSRPINTIFHEFGFRGNHVQAQLGQYPYTLTSNPASLEDLQRRDLTYYWEVILDLTKRALAASGGEESRNEFRALAALERTLGLAEGALTRLAPATHGALPAFTRSNVIVIDEAGLLGRHLLTAVVYCWWMINALYHTPPVRGPPAARVGVCGLADADGVPGVDLRAPETAVFRPPERERAHVPHLQPHAAGVRPPLV